MTETTFTRLAFLLIAAFGAASCTRTLPINNRPCPCASGWQCCADANVCVAEHATCPAARFAITPGAVRLGIGRALAFTANSPASFALVESVDGGTLSGEGIYTAPMTAGIWHVVATERADPTHTATAEVTVVPLALDLVDGELGGPGDADGTGEQARVGSNAWNIVKGENGAYYITDGNLLRRFDSGSGSLTTIAGRRGPTPSIDGVGRAASFSSLWAGALAFDGASTLYIADGALIRALDVATLRVSTFASLPDAAPFGGPRAIAFSTGQLYMIVGNAVERIDAQSGEVAMLAGSVSERGLVNGIGAAARFDIPLDLAADGTGNLFVAEDDHVIRRIDLPSASVSTYAGGAPGPVQIDGPVASATFGEAGRLKYDGVDPRRLVVVDSGALTLIRRIDLESNLVTTMKSVPQRVRDLAPTGNVAGVLRDNIVERRFLQVDTVLASAGKQRGSSPFRYPECARTTAAGRTELLSIRPTTDGQYGIYSFDTSSRQLEQIVSISGLAPSGWSWTYPPFGTPALGDGELFALMVTKIEGSGSSAYAWGTVLYRISLTTGVATAIAGDPNQSGTDDGQGAQARFRLTLPQRTDTAAQLTYRNGFVYVGEWQYSTPAGTAGPADGRVRAVEVATGLVTTLAGKLGEGGSQDGPGAQARFGRPEGLATDGAGHLFVADSANGTVRVIDLASLDVTTLAGDPQHRGHADGVGPAARFEAPSQIVFDGLANLYVSDAGDSTLRQIHIETGETSTIAGEPYQGGVRLGRPRLNAPARLMLTNAGDLLISDSNEAALLLLRAQ